VQLLLVLVTIKRALAAKKEKAAKVINGILQII
jgi:hypothetical protein